jgi:hypothetical protein
MYRTRSAVWTSLLIAVVVVAASGCATAGVPKPITSMQSIAGTWIGPASLPGGVNVPSARVTIAPDGTYSAIAGAFSAQGKAEIKDGALTMVPTSSTGGLAMVAGNRSSSASLTDRGGSMVLTGYGHSDKGPFYFELTKQ